MLTSRLSSGLFLLEYLKGKLSLAVGLGFLLSAHSNIPYLHPLPTDVSLKNCIIKPSMFSSDYNLQRTTLVNATIAKLCNYFC